MMRCSIFALFLALALTSCADRAKRSKTLYEAGDYAGAAHAADEGLAGHPDDDALWGMRVRAALALGDGDGIAKSYEQYVSQRGKDDKELLRDLATATIAQALASPSARLKIEAIDAVAELEINALADQVAERLGDDDERVQAAAAIAVLHGYPQAPQVADAMMRSENAEARRIAVDGVGKKVGKLAVADIEKSASDGDARVRAIALRWLGVMKDADAVEIATKRLHDPDESVRAAAATCLAKIGLGNLEAMGKQALKDKALSVRLAGIELLVAANRGDELVALADDPDPTVGVEAAIAAKRAHPELAPKAIQRAIAADDWHVRAGAANALTRALGTDAALPIAQKLATDKELGVRLAAARMLAHAGDKETARRVFTEALAVADSDVQAAADLAALGDTSGGTSLSTFVRDAKRSPEARAAAASAHRTAHRVTPGLVAALADPSGLVRIDAAATLGTLAKGK
jgi:HEAT repeat protein